ncbi:hypothetical protein AGMMS49546_26120 [Spirochaetia bacterium]|nr:hypothetical protein AGMMS49546_26120 [Spirochaetia bacterium]
MKRNRFLGWGMIEMNRKINFLGFARGVRGYGDGGGVYLV